jgi:hypothetical protein
MFEYIRRSAAVAALAAALCCTAPPASTSANAGPDCRIEAGSCEKITRGFSVVFDIVPKPVKPMNELTFSATLKDRGTPVEDASVLLDLSMPGMYMGKNVVALRYAAAGVYSGTGVIVRCPTGGRIWKATVTIKRGGGEAVVDYVFETAP